MIRAREHIPGLDGIRAISALIVAAMHFGVFPWGWCGVQFFYVLSGYLITRALFATRERATTLRAYLGDFYLRRARRIFPLYYGYVTFALLVSFASHSELARDRQYAPSLLLYCFNITRAVLSPGFGNSLVSHLWSLSVEEQFYLVWPFLIYFAPAKRLRLLAALFVVFAVVLRWGAEACFPQTANLSIYYLTPFQVDGFALGGLLALLTLDELALVRKAVTPFVLVAVVLAAIHFQHDAYLGLTWPLKGTKAVVLYTLVDLVGAAGVAECVLRSPLSKALELSPLRFMGRVSYGFYVWHLAVLTVINHIFGASAFSRRERATLFPAYVILVLCAATASYFLFERRFMRPSQRRELVQMSPSLGVASHKASRFR